MSRDAEGISKEPGTRTHASPTRRHYRELNDIRGGHRASYMLGQEDMTKKT